MGRYIYQFWCNLFFKFSLLFDNNENRYLSTSYIQVNFHSDQMPGGSHYKSFLLNAHNGRIIRCGFTFSEHFVIKLYWFFPYSIDYHTTVTFSKIQNCPRRPLRWPVLYRTTEKRRVINRSMTILWTSLRSRLVKSGAIKLTNNELRDCNNVQIERRLKKLSTEQPWR